ncbi:Hpt domain-containing protein [Ramlibacter sp.]|uniref:Hpt domain-containing protein n=1 Tax=Ramlibacter sp. TaxID=1917967 RepID=UPI002D3653DD|nr:Hpt domain-containing protein [Ramlibacter sp.]HYD77730.1 Hpt domain-containing protein [Ramlibacter sp.]
MQAATDIDLSTQDLGPLAWVLDELRKSLETASAALRRFVRDAALARGQDMASVDDGQLRIARQQLHQAVGALEMVGLGAPALILRAMEAAVQKFVERPELCSEAAAAKVDRAGFALAEFLESVLHGKSISPVALFPQYKDVQELAGGDRLHPADLWVIDWRWLEPETPAAAEALAYDAALRSRMDQAVLRIVKSADPAAAAELADICTGLATGQQARQPRIFWKLAAAYFEAMALGLLPADVYVKRGGSRVLLQYASLAKGELGVSDRLAQDLLFFCCQAVPPAGVAAPSLAAVRAAWGLDRFTPVDYQTAQFGRFDPALLSQIRKRIAAGKESWSAVSGGDPGKLKAVGEQFHQIGDVLTRLHPPSAPLARSLGAAVEAVVRSGRPPQPELAMEVATAVLYLEAAFQDLDPTDSQLASRTARLAERLEQVSRSGHALALEPWMEELYRRVSDRQTMGSVVGELRGTLAELEKLLDAFFRNPQDKGPLANAPSHLLQMRGVLSVLGLEQASQAVARMRETVEAIIDTEIDEAQVHQAGTFEKLGNNLGALGFLIDMLNYQPALAKKLFVYDDAHGELRPLMGRAEAPAQYLGLEGEAAMPQAAAAPAAAAVVPASVPLAAAAAPAVVQPAIAVAAAPAVAPAPAPVDEDDAELREIFLEEAREVVGNGLAAVEALAANPADVGELTTLRRAFHTLKGSSRMVGLNEFGEAGWAMEQVLNTWLADQKPASDDLRTLSGEALRGFGRWIEDIAARTDAAWKSAMFRGPADAFRTEARLLALVLPGDAPTAQATAPADAASPSVPSVPEALGVPAVPEVPAVPDAPEVPAEAAAPDAIAFDLAPEPAAAAAEGPDLAAIDFGDLSPATGGETAAVEPSADMPAPEALPAFDLDFGSEAPAAPPVEAENPQLATTQTIQVPVEAPPTPEVPPAFDLDFGSEAPAAPAAELEDPQFATTQTIRVPVEEAQAPTAPELPADFVLDLGTTEAPAPAAPAEAPAEFERIDFTSLGALSGAAPAPAPAAPASEADAEADPEPAFEIELPASPVEPMAADPVPEEVVAADPQPTETAATEPTEATATEAAATEPTVEAAGTEPAGEAAGTEPAGEAPADEWPADFASADVEVIEVTASAQPAEAGASAWGVLESAAAPLDDQTKVIGTLRIGIPLYNVYLNEADEWSRRLEQELGEWALQVSEPVPDSVVGLAHALAGSSATVGFHALSDVARALESALQHAQTLAWGTQQHGRTFVRATAEIRRLLHQFAAGFLKEADPAVAEALAALDQLEVPRRAELADSGRGGLEGLDLDEPFEPADLTAPAAATAASPAAERPQPVDGPAPHFDGEGDEDDIDVADAIDPDLFPIFEDEAVELFPRMGAALRQWAQQGQRGGRDEVLRALHTLKGSARLAGALRLGEMAHRMESVVETIPVEAPAAEVEPLLHRFDKLQARFDALRTSAAQPPAEAPAEPAVEAVQLAEPAAPAAPAAGRAVLAAPVTTQLAPQRASASHAVRVRSQLLDRLVNQAGEVMITRSRLENELRNLRGSLQDLTGGLDRLRSQLRDIELQAETQMQSRLAQSRDSAAFDPLEFDRFTRVQELTRMMAESVNDVATVQRNLQRAVEATEDDLIAQARQTRELQRDLLRTRMVEFDGISDRLYRVVRLASKETGKQVKLDITGGSIEMDRGVLDRMTPAFEHLLRNCVAHGIEDAATRLAAGKEAAGAIQVDVSQEGNDVSVEFRDDGAGLDLARIRDKALKQGLITPAQQLTEADAANLIFMPGFSTAAEVTELAGRGIGMDVVRSEVNALGGRIETVTQRGQGTRFKLVLPLTTAVTQVVMVRSGSLSIGVPANLVEIVRRASAKEVQQAYNSGRFEFGGESLPFFWSGALLQSSAHSSEPQARTLPVVVFRSAAQRIAVHVDEVLGNQEVVVKNLGPQLARLPGLAGMTVLASGAVVLIYNPVALSSVYGEQARRLSADRAQPEVLEQAGGAAVAVAAAQAVPQVPMVLVVDDSITVRRVTQRLLQREGYRVVLAADGLQALERLAEERPAVVLSDIEMPRMDGFDLARNIRFDPRWSDLPIVMITSRIAEKHREHARELGVNHYLGKPYSEEELLSLVRHYCTAASSATPA